MDVTNDTDDSLRGAGSDGTAKKASEEPPSRSTESERDTNSNSTDFRKRGIVFKGRYMVYSSLQV